MEELQRRLSNGGYTHFIDGIRFPNLKNLAPGLAIEFSHPITALVGPNGTNKTTVLRALQGCPRGMDLGEHWFETGIDRVESEPARYIYRYRAPSGAAAEVIKTRVARAGRRKDYFETRAPRTSDGMASMSTEIDPRDADVRNETRWRPIPMPVVYLDFRHSIPAFDIHFMLNHAKRDNAIERKKALVRRRSQHLSDAIASGADRQEYYGWNRILTPARELTPVELRQVSTILERKYESIRLLRHDFFDIEGDTALITQSGRAYSEAFAGSGEFAAIVLVRALSAAPNGALVLLDEPETSLHPRAQEKLMGVVAEVALRKGLQVVFSTHSPSLVAGLPLGSVKVLDIGAAGTVELVAQCATPREAFNRLGATVDPAHAVVEDELAREILVRAARCIGSDATESLDVRVVPGGAESISNYAVPALSAAGQSTFVVLDGDKSPGSEMLPPGEIADADLDAQLKVFGISKSRHRDSDEKPGTAKWYARNRSLYAWCFERLRFLPGGVPEALLLEMLGEEAPASSEDAKAVWRERCAEELRLTAAEIPNSAAILATQTRALAKVSDESPLLKEVVGLVREIVGS
ncbi:ATP-dependent nuclease [Cellulomonas soli]|uniref:ATP-dependent nuclease n=1 Tax=Cellulomonas soli TaxID=931535 RepID=UPI003F8632BE